MLQCVVSLVNSSQHVINNHRSSKEEKGGVGLYALFPESLSSCDQFKGQVRGGMTNTTKQIYHLTRILTFVSHFELSNDRRFQRRSDNLVHMWLPHDKEANTN